MRSRSVLSIFLLGTFAASCDGTPITSAASGPVQLDLSSPPGAVIDAIDWRVLSSSGAVLSAGHVDSSAPSSSPSVIVSVPSGLGETVGVSATLDGGVTCTGTSAPFNVTPGQQVNVAVGVVCGPAGGNGDLGSLLVTATVVPGDDCPALTSWLIAPAPPPSTGERIDVDAIARDADPGDSLAYAWSATAGSFVDATATGTTYLCAAPGPQTLTVTIADNHQPIPCSVVVRFPAVQCP